MSRAVVRRLSGGWRRIAVGLGLLVLLAAGMLLWLRPEEPAIGEQFRGSTEYVTDPIERYVALPGGGILEVELGPVPKVVRGGETAAPEGDRLVSVTWGLDDSYAGLAVWPAAGAESRREPESQLLLTVGGRSFPLAAGLRSSSDRGATIVRVPVGGELGVRVKSGRRDLPVLADVPGAGQVPSRVSTPCGSAEAAPVEPSGVRLSGVVCTLQQKRGTYVAGLGWAPAGQEWVIVQGALQIQEELVGRWRDPRDERRDTEYVPAATPTLRLSVRGGRVERVTEGRLPGLFVGESATPTTAFLVPAGSAGEAVLTVALAARKVAYDGAPPSPRAPQTVTFRLQATAATTGTP